MVETALTLLSGAGTLGGLVPGVVGPKRVVRLNSDRREQGGVSCLSDGGRIAPPVGACASSGCSARRVFMMPLFVVSQVKRQRPITCKKGE
jgi:hypothetical protein